MNKKYFFIVIVFLLLLVTTNINATGVVTFEELKGLDRTEKLEKLLDVGLKLPEFYSEHLDYTKNVVSELLIEIEKGNIIEDAIPFNYDQLVELTRNLFKIVKNEKIVCYNKLYYSYHRLEDSTPIGRWKESYKTYNCYPYALNRTDDLRLGEYSNQHWNPFMNIEQTANIVLDDLSQMRYTAYKTKTLGDRIYSRANVIAVRIGGRDYHFMKDVYREREWEHKPGTTQPLRWNYSSPEYKIWTNEAVVDGEILPPYKNYDSEIIYIYYWPEDEGPRPYELKHLLKIKEIK